MLKQLFKALPILCIALVSAGVLAIVDSYTFIKMKELMDIALSGDMTHFKETAGVLILMAVCLVPLCILTAVTRALYKRRANLNMKRYYVKGVFGKNISEFHKENNAKYISSLTNDFNLLEVNLTDSIYEIGVCLLNFFAGIWMIATVTP